MAPAGVIQSICRCIDCQVVTVRYSCFELHFKLMSRVATSQWTCSTAPWQ